MASCSSSRHFSCGFLRVLLLLTCGMACGNAKKVYNICVKIVRMNLCVCMRVCGGGGVINSLCKLLCLAASHSPYKHTDHLRPCPVECNVTIAAPCTVMNKIILSGMESFTHNDYTRTAVKVKPLTPCQLWLCFQNISEEHPRSCVGVSLQMGFMSVGCGRNY